MSEKRKNSNFDIKWIWENFGPPAVLMIICGIVCALLVVAYNLTYVDTTGVLTDELKSGCEAVLGEGEYEMLSELSVEGVTSIIVDKEKGTCAFEIVADGYNKGGLHVLVGIGTDGAVAGISFVSISETPGLGTKVQDSKYLKQFIGQSTAEIEADNVTGATYSSKGMKKAVALAVQTYQDERGAIFGE